MHTVTSNDGTTIAYDRTGSGPPVILVGGAFSYRNFPGSLELVRLLNPHFTLINYDRRARGDSTDTQPYSVDREIEDLDALIHAAGGAASVWGMSSGAALAILGASRGLKINRLSLYEPPYMVGSVGHRPPPDHQAKLRELVAQNKRAGAVDYFINKVMGAPWIVVAIMRFFPFWPRLKAVAHTLPYDSAIMGDFSFPRSTVASIRVPTQIVSGAKSPRVLRDAANAVAQALPGAVHVELSGQSHNVSMKALAPVLIEFFGATSDRTGRNT